MTKDRTIIKLKFDYTHICISILLIKSPVEIVFLLQKCSVYVDCVVLLYYDQYDWWEFLDALKFPFAFNNLICMACQTLTSLYFSRLQI